MPGSDRIFKIMVAGEGGVGKTTLLLKYVSGSFMESTSMTIGVQFHQKNLKLDGVNYSLSLWDLGGQDRFRFMLPSYTTGAKGALLLYDMTRMTSLDTLEEWVNICRTNNKTIPILLCGTKADIENERSVSPEYASSFLQPLNLCGHLELSSKTGQNVERAFENIVQKIVEQLSPANAGVSAPAEAPVKVVPEPAPNANASIPAPAPAPASVVGELDPIVAPDMPVPTPPSPPSYDIAESEPRVDPNIPVPAPLPAPARVKAEEGPVVSPGIPAPAPPPPPAQVVVASEPIVDPGMPVPTPPPPPAQVVAELEPVVPPSMPTLVPAPPAVVPPEMGLVTNTDAPEPATTLMKDEAAQPAAIEKQILGQKPPPNENEPEKDLLPKKPE